MSVSRGALLKRVSRQPAVESDRGTCQYKDKSTGPASSARLIRSKSLSKVEGVPTDARAKSLPLPKHVQHCHGRGSRGWWIYTWKKATPGLKTRVPYNCNSWRCDACRRHEAAVTFARIRQACAPLSADGFVYFVLTIDRNGTLSGNPWKDAETAYRELGKMQAAFMRRLRKWMKRQGMRVLGNEWVSVVEAHRSGWPHLNVMLHSPELAEFLARDRAERESQGMQWPQTVWLSGELSDMATNSGWGAISTAERAHSRDALIGYVTKLAGLADRAAGEIAKLTQLPLNAPERFRRLRSGKGFLPPRAKNEAVTGTLVRRNYAADGTPHVMPLHKVPPAAVPHVAACCYQEERILVDELTSERWNRVARGLWPEAVFSVPVVSVWPLPVEVPRGVAP